MAKKCSTCQGTGMVRRVMGFIEPATRQPFVETLSEQRVFEYPCPECKVPHG